VAWREVPVDEPLLLLAHAPGDLTRIAAVAAAEGLRPPTLSLSGHTHGGQLRVPGLPALLPPHSGRFVAGWYDLGSWPAYVSRGVGTSVVPARFACRPEVACFSATGPTVDAARAG
jgi:predicted MPP superfamily phosphohydrolase